MGRGENVEAIDRLKDALAIERDNRDYQRALAQAQLAAGKGDEAEATLTGLLQNDSTDGPANLLLARVLVKEGQFAQAISYFHRAIYAHWSEDASGNRLKVRFELIDVLAQRNSKEELLAELLPVQDQSPGDLRTRLRMGRLFLVAGSPPRAADVFRAILHDVPAPPTGLGDADLARGNYREAQKDLLTALRLKPNDQAARQTLEVCNKVLMLDRTIRGLGRAERFRRSVKLVELALVATAQCVGPTAEPGARDGSRRQGKAKRSEARG
jgi:tetratricopeptide (TPR) repeat protein